MKTTTCFLAFICFFIFTALHAQSSGCGVIINPLACSTDPLTPLISDSDVAKEMAVSYAQKNKIFDISYYSSESFLSDCGTVSPYSCTSNMDDILIYDVYYPNPQVYSCYKENPLPAIILFHGGGFSDCSTSDGTGGIAQYCMEFAKRGFVAFNVQYRTGRLKDPQTIPGESGNYFSASNFLAIYRAYQDARGAVTSIISRQLSKRPPQYRIDLNNIFAGGVSAGGFIASSLAYYTPEMLYEIFGGAETKLGKLNGNGYKNNPDIKFKIRGVLNLWGGAYAPAAYSTAISDYFKKNRDKNGKNLNPPMIAFQGLQDFTIPPRKVSMFYSVSSAFGKTKICTDTEDSFYELSNNDTEKPVKDLTMFGTQTFYEMLTGELKIPSELYLDSDMQHGLGENSDFGTKLNVKKDKTLIIPYFVQRSVAFFQAVVNGFDSRLVDTKFIDCENFRTGCSPGNNHAPCLAAGATGNLHSDLAAVNANEKNFNVTLLNRNICIRFLKEGPSQIFMTDVYGKAVKQQSGSHTKQVTIDAANLSAGIYVLTVTQDGKTKSAKISLL